MVGYGSLTIYSSSTGPSILPQDGGHKNKSLHCEMKSLHVLSKQPTLRACYKIPTRITNVKGTQVQIEKKGKKIEVVRRYFIK